MSNTNCYYHQDQNAIVKCKKCFKLLCKHCKTVDTIELVKVTHYDRIGDIPSFTVTKNLDICGQPQTPLY